MFNSIQSLCVIGAVSLLSACGGSDDQPNVVETLQADQPLLTAVPSYHVLDGRVRKADVPAGAAIQTLQGETFTVDATLTITDQRGRQAGITATGVLAVTA